MPWCLPTLFCVTASTTCASTTACSRHSATTLMHTPRPVRVRGSPSAGGTAPSVVSPMNPNANPEYKHPKFTLHVLKCLSFTAALPCPPNSHYSECTAPCPPTCSDLFPIFCHLPPATCVEGCQCDAGHVLSDNNCVPLDKCGCQDSDREYHDVSFKNELVLCTAPGATAIGNLKAVLITGMSSMTSDDDPSNQSSRVFLSSQVLNGKWEPSGNFL